jgi:hypothetical protein
MSYGDARYQTKRISIKGLKVSGVAPSDASRSAQLDGSDFSTVTPYFEAGPIPTKTITANPYATTNGIRTFSEPIPNSDPQPPAPEFSYAQPEGFLEPAGPRHMGASRIYELAEKYVNVFQAHAAAQMTPAQRRALVAEVATFYSVPFRAGRLEALVSAFED